MMRVIWTPEVTATFNQNITFLEENWYESVIANFISKTDGAILFISRSPASFPVVDKAKGVRKILVVKQITPYYKVVDKTIFLLTFWNNYQDPKKLKL